MAQTINPKLARLMADLTEAVDEVILKHPEAMEIFGPIDVRVYTTDGYTAAFFEEGIEFYPKES